jgi:hypothetical protein
VFRFGFCFSLYYVCACNAVIICYFIALEGSYQVILFCFDLQADIANSLGANKGPKNKLNKLINLLTV